jgi:hypothetical protein
VVVVAQSQALEIIRGHVKIFIVEVWNRNPLHHNLTKWLNGCINGWAGVVINGSP